MNNKLFTTPHSLIILILFVFKKNRIHAEIKIPPKIKEKSVKKNTVKYVVGQN